MPQRTVYLGLGSNLGDRRENLARALDGLAGAGLAQMRVSPVMETPALLPERAPSAWNRPFLNLVVEGRAGGSPQDWLAHCKRIQSEFGPRDQSRWSPRAMDIDLLLWGDEQLRDEGLRIPHPEILSRPFVLSPLVHLSPRLRIPGAGPASVLDHSRLLPHHLPVWMGIVNLTPDSFSDGGVHAQWPAVRAFLDALPDGGAHVVDLGAESTRPKATPLAPEQEWERLAPVLERVLEHLGGDRLRPLVSVDTRHAEVARRALELGADILNDVSGLTDPRMIAVAAEHGCPCIAMHHLTVPADPAVTLPEGSDPCAEVERWLVERMVRWEAAGLDLGRIVFDPGVGFGKTGLQSLELLRHVERFRSHGLRVLVGHSRKSFISDFSGRPPAERDVDTIGASLKLCQKGVDVLRVHDVSGHVRAFGAWAHLDAYGK